MPRAVTLRRWGKAVSHRRFRWLLALTVVWTAGVMVTLLKTLRRVESRPGAVLQDPILALLPAANLSVPIFVVEYGCMLAVLWLLLRRPIRMTVALMGFGIAMCFRLITVLITPLDPPPDLIPLVDPLVSAFDGGPELTKDLFFSGHTTAMVIFAVASPSRRLRLVIVIMTLAIAVMLMIQRVHYAADVFVAPAMGYAGWQLARWVAPGVLGLKRKRRLARRRVE